MQFSRFTDNGGRVVGNHVNIEFALEGPRYAVWEVGSVTSTLRSKLKKLGIVRPR